MLLPDGDFLNRSLLSCGIGRLLLLRAACASGPSPSARASIRLAVKSSSAPVSLGPSRTLLAMDQRRHVQAFQVSVSAIFGQRKHEPPRVPRVGNQPVRPAVQGECIPHGKEKAQHHLDPEIEDGSRASQTRSPRSWTRTRCGWRCDPRFSPRSTDQSKILSTQNMA